MNQMNEYTNYLCVSANIMELHVRFDFKSKVSKYRHIAPYAQNSNAIHRTLVRFIIISISLFISDLVVSICMCYTPNHVRFQTNICGHIC